MTNNPLSASALIEIDHASVRLGKNRVLSIDSFSIQPGQHWCIFGGNGTGKTLLSQLLSGQLSGGAQYTRYRPGFEVARDIFTVSFEEQQTLFARDNRHDISEFTDNAQDSGTTVAALLHSDDINGERKNPDLSILKALGIDSLMDRGIRYLSSGQVRKVLIARALQAARFHPYPSLLILDDPLEAIDKVSRECIVNLLQEALGSETCSLLLCRREEEILPGITHMAVMENLRIIARGDADTMRQHDAFQRIVRHRSSAVVELPAGDTGGLPVSDSSPLLHLADVSASYGDTSVLRNISWRMDVGTHTVIQGPNGCGKSTLLSLVNGENHKAYGQQVYLFGVLRGSGESVWDIKSRFGVVSNEIHNRYLRGWKVIDVVVSGFFDSVGLYDDSGDSQVSLARQWLGALGISELERNDYQRLSFGQQKLVLLARAMVKNPRILILDEPGVGLDDYFRHLILVCTDAIAARGGTQIIYVSHTRDEMPACINQRLEFIEDSREGYSLEVTDI